MLDIQAIRSDFPILSRKIYGKDLVYLDNGATTQKPRCVVEKIEEGYYNVNANIHRGVHFLSQAATEAHEEARKTIQQFLNARHATKYTYTGDHRSINLIASSFIRFMQNEGDEVILRLWNTIPTSSLADTGCQKRNHPQGDTYQRAGRIVYGYLPESVLGTNPTGFRNACIQCIGYGKPGQGDD